MSTKTTLVARFHVDVTDMPDAVIEAYKTLIRHSAKDNAMVSKVDFEVLVENQEDTATRMLNAVRSEFQELTEELSRLEAIGNSEEYRASMRLVAEGYGVKDDEDEVAEAEKNDGFADFLRLVIASDEDEEEAEEDEEDDDE
jgi:hypothetical protein